MPQENSPLGKLYVGGYDGDEQTYPIAFRNMDERAAGYAIPADYSAPLEPGFTTHQFVGVFPTDTDRRVIWRYMLLPGPYIPFTRYDEQLGPIQGQRRSVKNTGQAASQTATVKITYEARDGSSLVSWEVSETNSNGTGGGSNPAFPIFVDDTYNEQLRGEIHETQQVTTDLASISSLSINPGSGVVTKIEYLPYEGNPNLRIKRITSWASNEADGQVLNQWGVADTSLREVQPGSDVDSSSLVLESQVTPLTIDLSRKETTSLQNLDTVLFGTVVEEDTGIAINVAAKLVPNGTVGGVNAPVSVNITGATVAAQSVLTLSSNTSLVVGTQITVAGNSNTTPTINGTHRVVALGSGTATIDFQVTANASGGTGGTAILSAPVYREVQRWKSNLAIQVSSQVDATSLAAAERTWLTEIDYAFPDSLVGLDVYNDTSESTSDPTGTLPIFYSITYSNSSNASGVVAVRIKDGYRGKVDAEITQTYSIGPPELSETVQRIRLSSGTAVVTSGGFEESITEVVHSLGTYDVISQSTTIRYSTVSLNNLLTGSFSTSNLASGSFSSGSCQATIDLKLDASSPTTFVAGATFISDVKVTPGRLGLYIKEVVTITVPTPFP